MKQPVWLIIFFFDPMDFSIPGSPVNPWGHKESDMTEQLNWTLFFSLFTIMVVKWNMKNTQFFKKKGKSKKQTKKNTINRNSKMLHWKPIILIITLNRNGLHLSFSTLMLPTFRAGKFLVGASQVVLVVKNPPANAGDIRDSSLIPGWGRSPGGGNDNPLQYSCLENPRDRGARRATVHRVAKSPTRLKRLSTAQHSS